MSAQNIFPKITEFSVCLFSEDNDLETRYIVAYFEPILRKKDSDKGSHFLVSERQWKKLSVNFTHFYRGKDPFEKDITISLDKKGTETFINLFGGERNICLKNLKKKFSSFSAFFAITALLRQENIAFNFEDTLEVNNEGLRYQFDDVHLGDKRLFDSEGNFIVPHMYHAPKDGTVKIYGGDNFLRYEFHYKNGMMDGLARCYFEHSKVIDWEQNYTKGKLDGRAERFYRKGTIRSSETFVKGVKEGPACEYDPSGYIDEEIIWAKNQKNGPAKKFYSNGQVRHEASFVNGLQEGDTRIYYESGKLKYEGTYRKGKAYGIGIGYHENGNKKYETPYKNGKIDGIDTYYYESGKVEWKIPYKNDLENGEVIQYYENGRIKQITLFKKGKKDGEFKSYHHSGKLRSKATYKKGKIHGKYIYYYNNGNICHEYNYKNGLRDGYSTAYHEKTAEIRHKIMFRKGLLVDPYGNRGIIGVKDDAQWGQNENK